MFLLFDGKNDRCWMVLPFWDTFNIEIDCSVMRLSCLDELLNNDILLSLSFAWYVLQRGSSILVEPFGIWRLMFYFVFLCKKWQHLFWMEFCKRGVEEKSWMDSSDCWWIRFCLWILEDFINWLDIADLFSFLISFALKKEEQESSLDFVIVHDQRRIIFSLSRGLKFVLCLLE